MKNINTFSFMFDLAVLNMTLVCLEYNISSVSKPSKIRHVVTGVNSESGNVNSA